MTRHRHQHRRRRGCGASGAVHRVLDGLSGVLGVGRDVVIAGFVVGLVFVPLLSAMVFAGAWYWVTYPRQAERHFEWLSAHVRRAMRRLAQALFGGADRGAATAPGFEGSAPSPASTPRASRQSPATASDLRRRFEELERRAKSIEAFVASEEYRLEREFDKMHKERDEDGN